MMVICRLCCVAMLAIALPAGRVWCADRDVPTGEFFVSPQGRDTWSGRFAQPNARRSDGPFATLHAARDAVRRLKKHPRNDGPIRVLIREGIYRVQSPFVLTADDSGNRASPVIYAAYPGERPVISGGLPITGWKRQPNSPLWTTVLPNLRSGKWSFRQLFVNGRRCVPARMPNAGFFRTDGPGVPLKNRRAAQRNPKTKRSFHYRAGDLRHWSDLDEAVVVVYHSWTTSRHRIQSLDEADHLVRFTAPSGWPMGWWEKNQRYYVEGIRAAVDRPGEWSLNRRTGVVTYYPRPGETMPTAEVVAPLTEELLRVDGDSAAGRFVEHVRFEGLAFRHTAWIMPAARVVDGQAAAGLKTAVVHLRGARNCRIERCEISRTGGYALWLDRGCQDNRVVQCHLHDLGAGGIRLGETALPGDPKQRAERNEIDNCFIHDCGQVFHAGVGVWIGRSSHNTVQHNEICDLFYTGVSVGWSWGYAPSTAHHNRIAFNHIHHLGWGQLSDMGGIYTLGVSPGTVLIQNRIHDVLAYSYGGWGLYTDEGSSGILIENNIVYRVKDGAFHQHYGRENVLRNNILALSATAGQLRRSRQESHRSFTIERNIIYSSAVPMLTGAWSDGHFQLDRNLYWDAGGKAPLFPGGLSFAQWQKKGFDRHSRVADPKFVNPARFDFRTQPDSAARAMGFHPIDTGKIGLTGPPEWTELPKRVQRPRMLMPGETRRR